MPSSLTDDDAAVMAPIAPAATTVTMTAGNRPSAMHNGTHRRRAQGASRVHWPNRETLQAASAAHRRIPPPVHRNSYSNAAAPTALQRRRGGKAIIYGKQNDNR